MKFLLLSIFAALFVAMPLYLLDTILMPELNQFKQTYARTDAAAASISGNADAAN